MDDALRRELAEAFAEDDRLRRDFERHEWQQQQKQRRLVYKTNENALIPKQIDAGDYVTHDELMAALGDLADAIGAEMGAIDKEMLENLEGQISALRDEVAALRPDMQSRKSGIVTPIRGRDVA